LFDVLESIVRAAVFFRKESVSEAVPKTQWRLTKPTEEGDPKLKKAILLKLSAA
jgi:hypothetical protein